MNYFGNLGYSVVNGAATSAISMGNNWLRGVLGISGPRPGQKIEYYYNYQPGANFILTHTAPILRAAAQYAKEYAISEVKKILKGKTVGSSKSNWSCLIEDYSSHVLKKHYGMLEVNGKGSGKYIPAINNYGEYCPEAFIMGIKLEKPINYRMSRHKRGGVSERVNSINASSYFGEDVSIPETTDTLVWFDPIAIPTINSDKNVLLTPVQGRDYTRKEIIGNGDIKFTVSGKMVSGVPGVYPTAEVEKFSQIMKHKGLVYCNHYILDILGIDKFIILSWSLSPRQGFGDNEQEYTFSAVGVMPDKETKVNADTISILDYRINEEKKAGKGMWATLVGNKLEGLKSAGLDTGERAADIGINKMIGLL